MRQYSCRNGPKLKINSFKARAHLPPDGVELNSNVASLEYVDGALVVVLACSIDQEKNVKGMKLTFSEASGFRLLDESALARYWAATDFPWGVHLLEVTDGGWGAEENALQGLEAPRREWLVITGNACVNVYCSSEPEVVHTSWKYLGG
jgi:hypothetical protein